MARYDTIVLSRIVNMRDNRISAACNLCISLPRSGAGVGARNLAPP